VCWGGGEAAPHCLSAWPQERYYVLYIHPSHIHRRKFDPKGNETEPNFSATRKVNTGFLLSSYSRYPLPFLPQGGLATRTRFLSMVGLDPGVCPPCWTFLPSSCSEDPTASPKSQGPGGPDQLLPFPGVLQSRHKLGFGLSLPLCRPGRGPTTFSSTVQILIWLLSPISASLCCYGYVLDWVTCKQQKFSAPSFSGLEVQDKVLADPVRGEGCLSRQKGKMTPSHLFFFFK
jgi:hypothetical protein